MKLKDVTVAGTTYSVCRYISRIDQRLTNGWMVRVPTIEGTATKFFKDGTDTKKALVQAMKFILDEVELLPRAVEKESAAKVHKTGVRGISIQRQARGKSAQVTVIARNPATGEAKAFYVGMERNVTQKLLNQKLKEAARYIEEESLAVPDKWKLKTAQFKSEVRTLLETYECKPKRPSRSTPSSRNSSASPRSSASRARSGSSAGEQNSASI